jgi:15-O-acetyltransferase Tri3
MDVVAAVTPIGALGQEDLPSLFREAWKVLRFHHPTIAAYIVDETKYTYDVPNSVALEKWASETFKVVKNQTADEVIASTTRSPYLTMAYLSQTGELVAHSQHWRTDGVGGFILIDDFLSIVAQFSTDASSLPWGEEVTRLAPSIEEAAGITINPSEADKKLGKDYVANFSHAVGAIGIASYAPTEALPGGTRIASRRLTEEETNTVVQACKAQKLSVTAAVHASIAGANYALAAPTDQNKHYTSTIRYSFRPSLPKPYSGREYATTIFTTGWMIPVAAETSWAERAKIYHDEYRKGLSPEFISAHREYAIGLCNLVQSLPAGAPSPTDVDISSLGDVERILDREKGTAERGIRVDRVSGGLVMMNRQCVCHVWTFRGQLCLNLVYNEAFYEKTTMNAFLENVKGALLQKLAA